MYTWIDRSYCSHNQLIYKTINISRSPLWESQSGLGTFVHWCDFYKFFFSFLFCLVLDGKGFPVLPSDWINVSIKSDPVISIPTGGSFEIECEAAGSPPPSVKWTHEQNFISEVSSFGKFWDQRYMFADKE